MRLGSCVAVAVVYTSGCSSDWTPSLGTSICYGYSPKKTKRKKKERKKEKKKVGRLGVATAAITNLSPTPPPAGQAL